MAKIFRKFRIAALQKKRIVNYLLYVVGEITLIVIGILIAVALNNWNLRKNTDEQLSNVLHTVLEDLKSDTAEVGKTLRNYKKRSAVFVKVLEGNATRDDYLTQPFYGYLVSSYVPVTIERRGYDVLRQMVNSSQNRNDTLVNDLVHFYSVLCSDIETHKALLAQDVADNLNDWKREQTWLHHIMIGNFTDSYFEYILESDDYKNRVALHRSLAYGNYVPTLSAFAQRADAFVTSLEARLLKQ